MKYTLNEAFEAIKKIQEKEQASLSDHIIKMQEEVGEIAESYLLLTNYKLPKLTQEEEKLHLTEEAVDAIVVAMAILAANGASQLYVEHLLRAKIEKWEIAIEKKLELKSKNTENEIS